MTCFHPLTAYKLFSGKTKNNKSIIMFKKPESNCYEKIKIQCGQCIGCRIAKTRAWAIRCVHEASLWDDNCFLTLTYDEQHLPEKSTLVKKHHQQFLRDLRKKFCGTKRDKNGRRPIRYFMCGEYGDKNLRPHYHIALFNFDFPDKVIHEKASKGGFKIYQSKILDALWKKGMCVIGDITLESAAYIAAYCQKKVLGKYSQIHYARVDFETGEMELIEPEYIAMSRRPGIARGWYELYKSDIYPKDFVTSNGKKFLPPKYYDKIFDIEYPEMMKKIKKIRLKRLKKDDNNNTWQRLKVRKECTAARLKVKTRPYERA